MQLTKFFDGSVGDYVDELVGGLLQQIDDTVSDPNARQMDEYTCQVMLCNVEALAALAEGIRAVRLDGVPLFPHDLPELDQMETWRSTMVAEATRYYKCDFFRERASEEEIDGWIAEVDRVFRRLSKQCEVQAAAIEEYELRKRLAAHEPSVTPHDSEAFLDKIKSLMGGANQGREQTD